MTGKFCCITKNELADYKKKFKEIIELLWYVADTENISNWAESLRLSCAGQLEMMETLGDTFFNAIFAYAQEKEVILW